MQDIGKETRQIILSAVSLYLLHRILIGFKGIFILFLKFKWELKSIGYRRINWDFKFRSDFARVLKHFGSVVTGFTSLWWHIKVRYLSYLDSTLESSREMGTTKSIWKVFWPESNHFSPLSIKEALDH